MTQVLLFRLFINLHLYLNFAAHCHHASKSSAYQNFIHLIKYHITMVETSQIATNHRVRKSLFTGYHDLKQILLFKNLKSQVLVINKS